MKRVFLLLFCFLLLCLWAPCTSHADENFSSVERITQTLRGSGFILWGNITVYIDEYGNPKRIQTNPGDEVMTIRDLESGPPYLEVLRSESGKSRYVFHMLRD